MSQISKTQGLAELKRLDQRIDKSIRTLSIVTAKVGSKPPRGFDSVEEFNKKAKADLQSVLDLITRRNLIKSAIVIPICY